MKRDGTEIKVLHAPVISTVTEEFTQEFLDFWPFRSPPRILNWTQPYQTHLIKIPSLIWILSESFDLSKTTARHIVTASPYAESIGLRVYKTKDYRNWVKSQGVNYSDCGDSNRRSSRSGVGGGKK